MRNRAKCKLCNSIIESLHRYDYVKCACGEIAISGGLYELETSAKDYDNFLRVDDMGREISVEYRDPHETITETPNPPPLNTPRSLLNELKARLEADEKLPDQAHYMAVTHIDQRVYLTLVYHALDEILKKIGE
jgi:hypothetical protein